MIFYYLYSSVPIFFAFLLNHEKYEFRSKAALNLIVVLVTLIAVNRYQYNDTQNYQDKWQMISSGILSPVTTFDFLSSKLLGFGLTPRDLIGVYAIGTYFCLFNFIFKEFNYPGLVLIAWLLSDDYVFTWGAIRQSLSMSIYLYLSNRNSIILRRTRYFAFLLHPSVIILEVGFLASRIIRNSYFKVFLITGATLGIALITSLNSLAELIIDRDYSMYENTGINAVRVLIYCITPISVFLGLPSSASEKHKRLSLYAWMFAIIGLFGNANLYGRAVSMLDPYVFSSWLSLKFSHHSEVNKQMKLLILILVAIFGFYYLSIKDFNYSRYV